MKKICLLFCVLFLGHLASANTLTRVSGDEALVPASMVEDLNTYVSDDRELGVSVVSVYRGSSQNKSSVFLTFGNGPESNTSVFVIDDVLSMPTDFSFMQVSEGVYNLRFKIYQVGSTAEVTHSYQLHFDVTPDDMEFTHFVVQ